ncbi:MAG: DUF3499 family protein [Acidimicrobiia bacterium]
MSRMCARPGCSLEAAATLTYDYVARRVWVGDLEAERHPMAYDLCADHADGLRVPQGWALEDRRLRFPRALAS